MTGCSLPSLEDITVTSRYLNKANIKKEPSHRSDHLFELLASGQRHRSHIYFLWICIYNIQNLNKFTSVIHLYTALQDTALFLFYLSSVYALIQWQQRLLILVLVMITQNIRFTYNKKYLSLKLFLFTHSAMAILKKKKKKVDHVVTRRRKLAISFGLSSSRQTGRVAHLLSTITLWEGLPSTHVVEGAGAPTSPIMRGRGWPTHVTDRRSKRTTSDRRTARASSRVLLNLANG